MKVSAGLLIIGDELLSGRTQDQNIHFIASQFTQMGIDLEEVSIIPDVEVVIVKRVQEFSRRFDYVITTGGIGPTHDDITVVCVAKALGLKLEQNKYVVELMEQQYCNVINEERLKMACMPEGATLIESDVGHIPSFLAGNVLVLAGIPKIMRSMFLNAKKYLRNGKQVHNVVVRTSLKEGQFSACLRKLQNEYDDIQIGSYPIYSEGEGGSHVDLVLRGYDLDKLGQVAQRVRNMVEGIENS